MRLLAIVSFVCVLSGCAVPSYDPARVSYTGMEDEPAFRRCLDVVRTWFPNVETNAGELRMWSEWLTTDDLGRPARRRISLFFEPPEQVAFVVEVSYLEFDWLGEPRWTTPRGHSRWELELADALRASLDA